MTAKNNGTVMKKEKEFTISEGLAYMAGAIGVQLTTVMIAQWALAFYAPAKGSGKTIFVTLGMATLMMFVGRVFDAISDPIIGLWSDRFNGKLGRRRPFIIYGSLPLTIVFILFWCPPFGANATLNFFWGLFFVTAFYWLITIVLIPYLALLPEIAQSTSGRAKLGVYFGIGMFLGFFLGVFCGALIEKIGIIPTAVIYGIVSLICFQITGWTVKERYKQEGVASTLKETFSEFKSTLKNRPFLIFLIAETIFTVGFFVIQIALPDFNQVILQKGEGNVTIMMIPFLVIGFPLLFIIEPTLKKWNKKLTYAAGLLGFTLIFPLFTVAGLFPASTHIFGMDVDMRIIIILITTGLAGFPQAIKYIVPLVIIGEVADYDEKHLTGRRREGIYSGAIGFATKSAISLSYIIRYLVYTPFGEFSVDNPTPVLLIGPVTAAICFIGFLIFLKYPTLHVVKGEEE